MNRAEMLEAALRRIMEVHRGVRDGYLARNGFRQPDEVFGEIDAIARHALETDYPWPGEAQYNHPKDFAIAQEWMAKHARADETVFVKGRPVIALYYEPVANHYQQARRLFREFAERLRETFEADWI